MFHVRHLSFTRCNLGHLILLEQETKGVIGLPKVLHKFSVFRGSLCWSKFEKAVWSILRETIESISTAAAVV